MYLTYHVPLLLFPGSAMNYKGVFILTYNTYFHHVCVFKSSWLYAKQAVVFPYDFITVDGTEWLSDQSKIHYHMGKNVKNCMADVYGISRDALPVLLFHVKNMGSMLQFLLYWKTSNYELAESSAHSGLGSALP